MIEDWRDWWAVYTPPLLACAVALLAAMALAVFTWWCVCGPMGDIR